MTSFLIVFDRKAGRILTIDEYADRRAALHQRFVFERQYKNNSDIEVVVLVSESLENLKRTHGRYFGATFAGFAERVKQEFEDAAAERTRSAS